MKYVVSSGQMKGVVCVAKSPVLAAQKAIMETKPKKLGLLIEAKKFGSDNVNECWYMSTERVLKGIGAWGERVKPFAEIVETEDGWFALCGGKNIAGNPLADISWDDRVSIINEAFGKAVAEMDARIAELSELLERIERERSIHSDVWSRDITTEIRKALGKGE